jgi:hypothetical protein
VGVTIELDQLSIEHDSPLCCRHRFVVLAEFCKSDGVVAQRAGQVWQEGVTVELDQFSIELDALR